LPADAIVAQYCAATRSQDRSMQGSSMDVEIAASLPKLKKHGKLTALSLGEYKIPCIKDIPPLRTIHVTARSGMGPYGTKMAGELGNCAVAPAIVNAVANAAGVRLREYPVTAERIHAALHGAE